MISFLYFLKNVGGLIFISLFLLYTFITQAQQSVVVNGVSISVAQLNQTNINHLDLATSLVK